MTPQADDHRQTEPTTDPERRPEGSPPGEGPRVTVELAVARSTLRHVEVPEGYRAEVVHGEIILSPTRAFHLNTIIERHRRHHHPFPPGGLRALP